MPFLLHLLKVKVGLLLAGGEISGMIIGRAVYYVRKVKITGIDIIIDFGYYVGMERNVRIRVRKYGLIIAGVLIVAFAMWNVLYNFFINTKPSQYALKRCEIETTELEGRRFYTVTPKAEAESGKAIFYIHGGAYVGGMTKYHWQYITDLCEDTGATVLLPDYPLSPKAKCAEIIEYMSKVYEKKVTNYGTEQLYLMVPTVISKFAIPTCLNKKGCVTENF